MSRKGFITTTMTVLSLLILSGTTYGRSAIGTMDGREQGSLAAQSPAYCLAKHDVGQLVLGIINNGTFGNGFLPGSIPSADCFTGEIVPAGGCEYPKGANVQYLFAASFWVGAIVGRDTLVSTGADGWLGIREMFPDVSPFGDMIKRSIIDGEDENAVSEQDYIAVYTDTFVTLAGSDDADNGRVHRPLNIKIEQNSYAWSYSYAEDIVLFDYKVSNIGTRDLKNVYLGIYVDADVCDDCGGAGQGFTDDICGFLFAQERQFSDCIYLDTVSIAWIADNDGKLTASGDSRPSPHVTATRIVRTPAESLDVSFNWWISNGNATLDFGPRERDSVGRYKEKYRDFGTGGLGTPSRDVNRYYIMRNREFDYDQAFTATISPTDTLWLYPDQTLAPDFADGFDTRYLLSFGPFDIAPGQRLPVSFAYLAGENFHHVIGNGSNLPNDPGAFYANLNFEDLAINAQWASWIYDNPGVDTDNDDYYGEFLVCPLDSVVVDSTPIDTSGYSYTFEVTLEDTQWIKGDDVPDFQGAAPPPAPDFWLDPSPGKIKIRFNGTRSETTRDVFSRKLDFEGYRIYVGRDSRRTSFSVVNSYDREDFNKFAFNAQRNIWELTDIPFSIAQLRQLYNDSLLDPTLYSRTSPYRPAMYPESLLFFEPQDFNSSELGLSGGIRKIYPDQPYPSSINPDSARPDELTEDGYLKYFEYEYTVENLLPQVPYSINVTAFDFGSPESGLGALETSVTLGAKEAYPLASASTVAEGNTDILVYPNPYRLDADYRGLGFEGRIDQDRPSDRTREIHFANLPPKCTIRIFTVDGDLVREIDHDVPASDPLSPHESWDLITRNTQLVVSGLYYWTVETENAETQIGKIVIIM